MGFNFSAGLDSQSAWRACSGAGRALRLAPRPAAKLLLFLGFCAIIRRNDRKLRQKIPAAFALCALFAAQAPQAASAAAAGAAACRKAVLSGGGAKSSGSEIRRQLRETLIRSYEPIHKKKRERRAFQSRLNELLQKKLSAKEILSRLMAEGLISPESSSPLFGLILNQPEMAARLAEHSPEAVQEGSLLGSPPFLSLF